MANTNPLIALSVRQPWAWAIIFGGKDVENRSKMAINRGAMVATTIAVHASKGMSRDEYEAAAAFMSGIGVNCPRPDSLTRGAIIGTVEVTGITKNSDSDWFFGPWALELKNPQSFTENVVCDGRLGYFEWKRKPGAKLVEPLPWMIAWPEKRIAAQKPIQSSSERLLL